MPWHWKPLLWPLLLPRFSNFGWDWLTSQTRSVRGVVPRRAMHASGDSPCHSSAQPPLLGGLPPPHGAFQEHAAHLVEWSTTLNSKGSSGTCIPKGVATCFHAAFTAHSGSDVGDWVGRGRGSFAPFPPAPHRTVRNRFRVTRLSSGHDSPLQDHGYHTPFPGYRTPPVALRHVAGFPNPGLL